MPRRWQRLCASPLARARGLCCAVWLLAWAARALRVPTIELTLEPEPPSSNPALRNSNTHAIPAPYHSTNEVLTYVQMLAASCGNADAFRLEFARHHADEDLERDLLASQGKPLPRGKADEFFDSLQAINGDGEWVSQLEVGREAVHLRNRLVSQQQQQQQPRPTGHGTLAPATLSPELDDPPVPVLHLLRPPPPVGQDAAPPVSGQPNPHQRDVLTHLDDDQGVVTLPVLRVSLGNSTRPKPTALVMFGEHGREFVSCEIGMSFLRQLHDAVCGPSAIAPQPILDADLATDQEYTREQVVSLVQRWDLTILPIVSPSARRIAEKHDYCNRKNARNVDVNRNYPFHFGEGPPAEQSEQFAGPHPLSEGEAIISATIAKEINPTLFVSVHSGAELVLTSPAYRKLKLEQMPKDIQSVVTAIQQHHCPECKAGPASEVLPYLAYGCSMDYMFEEELELNPVATFATHPRFSFTFETWSGDKEKVREAQGQGLVGDDQTELVREQERAFQALGQQLDAHQFMCLRRFNPPPRLYSKLVRRWGKAVFSTLHAVAEDLDSKRA